MPPMIWQMILGYFGGIWPSQENLLNMYNYLMDRLRDNLHVCLCFSPVPGSLELGMAGMLLKSPVNVCQPLGILPLITGFPVAFTLEPIHGYGWWSHHWLPPLRIPVVLLVCWFINTYIYGIIVTVLLSRYSSMIPLINPGCLGWWIHSPHHEVTKVWPGWAAKGDQPKISVIIQPEVIMVLSRLAMDTLRSICDHWG